MSLISSAEKEEFFKAVHEVCRKAILCAVATVERGEPRVRIVHPSWEDDVLWFATSPQSPKVKQISENPVVDIQYQVAPPDYLHVMVRGRAELVRDQETKNRVWDVIEYDLTQFDLSGPDDPDFLPVKVVPTRVELSGTFGFTNKRVWRSS